MSQSLEQGQHTQQSPEPQEHSLKEKELTLEELASITGGLAPAVYIETAKGNKAVLE